MPNLTDDQRLDWLQLIRTENIGPVTFARLMSRFGSARAVIDALPQLAAKAGRKLPLKAAPRDAAFKGSLRPAFAASCGKASMTARADPKRDISRAKVTGPIFSVRIS